MSKGLTALKSVAVPAWIALVILCVVGGATVSGDRVLLQTLIESEIRLVLVIALFIFIGNSGVVSFVHVGFMMIGAYAAAWVTMNPAMKALFLPALPEIIANAALPLPLALLVGALAAGAIAFVSGLVICRLSGIGASIASFALFMALYALFRQASGWTAGQSSLVGLPVQIDAIKAFCCVALAIVVAMLHERSRWGLMLRASREDEAAARSSGINVAFQRLLAFVLSGCVAGLAGGLMSQFLGVLTVDMFYLDAIFISLAMLIIGGRASLAGAMIGTIVVSLIDHTLKQAEKGVDLFGTTVSFAPGVAEVGLGAALILTLVLRPRGLIGR